MENINFQPIFDYIDQQSEELLAKVASKKDIEKLQTSVDTLGHRFDKIDKNAVVETAKVEKIEHWVIQAAEKTKVPYKP
jgi:hypothetical protein